MRVLLLQMIPRINTTVHPTCLYSPLIVAGTSVRHSLTDLRSLSIVSITYGWWAEMIRRLRCQRFLGEADHKMRSCMKPEKDFQFLRLSRELIRLVATSEGPMGSFKYLSIKMLLTSDNCRNIPNSISPVSYYLKSLNKTCGDDEKIWSLTGYYFMHKFQRFIIDKTCRHHPHLTEISWLMITTLEIL